MNLLIKYPTRERFYQFELILRRAYELCDNKDNVHFLITYDMDDTNFNLDYARTFIPEKHITFIGGYSENKVHACNRDMKNSHLWVLWQWDAVMLLSDDMVCQVQGWDNDIKEAFDNDYDKAIHFRDGYTDLMTLALIGRKYYERFNYIYNPEYKSLFCDNEMMEVAKLLGKYQYNNNVIFKHEHYANNRRLRKDALMKKTESYFYEDKATYDKRKQINFGL